MKLTKPPRKRKKWETRAVATIGRCRRRGRKRRKREVETDPGGYADMLAFGQHRAGRGFSTECELYV